MMEKLHPKLDTFFFVLNPNFLPHFFAHASLGHKKNLTKFPRVNSLINTACALFSVTQGVQCTQIYILFFWEEGSTTEGKKTTSIVLPENQNGRISLIRK